MCQWLAFCITEQCVHCKTLLNMDAEVHCLFCVLHYRCLIKHRVNLRIFILWQIYIYIYILSNAPHVLVDFVVFSPGHGRSITDFWGWDTHEARLRCPDDVSGDIGGCSARRALKPKFYQPTQTMVTVGILPFRENSHGRTENRTRDLIISSQRLWPLEHEAGHLWQI